MANGLFAAYRTIVLSAPPNLSSTTLRIMGVDHADDTPVLATDDFINDILSAARVPALASCPTLGSKTLGVVAAGVFDAADPTFTLLSGDQFESLIIFEDSGTEATSDLIAFWDTATGLPCTPNGADLLVTFNASGVFTF
jgi:hypothetical protein